MFARSEEICHVAASINDLNTVFKDCSRVTALRLDEFVLSEHKDGIKSKASFANDVSVDSKKGMFLTLVSLY
eukprot:5577272-Amphidinium_carterae.1